jgi:ELWxxDGT repeat protein
MKSWLLSLCVLVSPAVLGLSLVKDINGVPTGNYAGGSTFDDSVQVSSGILYRMDDGVHGLELWITDGTPAGTRLVRDIRPGPVTSNIAQMTLVAGVAYFWADDGANGFELWRSDGTTAGTTIVANIGAGAAGFPGPLINSGHMISIGNAFYFIGFDAVGAYLWRSDGSASGTYKIGTFAASASTFNIRDLMVVGTRLFFLATDTAGEELWVSDGTAAGTRRVTSIPDDGQSPEWGQFTVLGDSLYFTVDDQAHGDELWRVGTDGTNPRMVVDLNNMSLSGLNKTAPSHPRGLFVVGNALIFEATTMTGPNSVNAQTFHKLYRLTAGSSTPVALMDTQFDAYPTNPISIGGSAIFQLLGPGNNLWVTNGTAAGTQNLTPVNFEMSAAPVVLYRGNEAFFFARSLSGGPNYYLWRTDGTAPGTDVYLQADFPITPFELASFNNRLYFQSQAAGTGIELWSTDGTAGGTRILRDILPGDDSGAGVGMFVASSRMYFTAYNADGNGEPWVTDGTEAATIRLAAVPPKFVTAGSRPLALGSLGASAFYVADDGVHGEELWISDGTSAGTRLVRDIVPGPGSTNILAMTPMNGFALFSATDAAGVELWRTDGTTNGTFRVKDIYPGPGDGYPKYLGPDSAVWNGFAYFVARDDVHDQQLWRSDGTEAGTTMVVETPGSNGVVVMQATANNRVFFLGAGNPTTLYSTDGTAAGTVVVSNSLGVVGQLRPVVFQNRICFNVFSQPVSYELYCSDGTAAGTSKITDFGALGMSAPSRPYLLNNKIVVKGVRPGGVAGGGMYACDGTPAGLTKISDLYLNDDGMPLNGGAQYAFFLPNGANTDILVTDGTAAGTRSMLAGTRLPRDSILNHAAAFGDSVVFTVSEPGRGPVLWKTDGTVAGTHYLFDIEPIDGLNSGEPSEFQQAGTRMFFRAGRSDLGEEIWSFTATNPNAVEDYAEVAFNTAANINVLANDSDFDSSLTGATVSIVTPPASGTASINSAGAITYTPNSGFAGFDQIVYRVTDAGGNASNPAYLSIAVAPAISNTPPGTAPVPTPNPPSNPPSSGGGGGGGGGALGLEALLLSLLSAWRLRPRARISPALH